MTQKEYIEAAEAALRQTTVTYPTWKRNIDQGKYRYPESTEWWKVFDNLAKAKAPPSPVLNIYPGSAYPSNARP